MSERLLSEPILALRGRQMSVHELLVGMTALKASDLYLKTGAPVRFKISGRVVTFESDRLTRDRMDHVLSCFLTDEARAGFAERQVADLVYETDKARFRVHFAQGHTGPYAAIRVINQSIPHLNELGLPRETLDKLLDLKSGLLVVCGSTDAGKTVTCTALLDYYNRTREQAILTLEDPIEYVFEDVKSMVLQREIGNHAATFSDGLKSALRENVDVIFVGEMRGLDTIEQVLRAAEMGHLVISTLHADDVLACISRIVGSFPPEEQGRIRQSLSGVLEGVLFQRLVSTASGGRTPVVESMWPNTAVRSIIRSGDVTKLGSYIGRSAGNRSFRDSLHELLNAGTISRETYAEQLADLPIV
jgi:twitching motility protein PilT